MLDLIATLPAQLRWARDLDAPAVPRAVEALVAGMGGSAMAGAVAASAAADGAGRVSLHRSYGLPGWVESAAPLVVAVSHSGETEEALSSADAALVSGVPVVGIGSGGSLADRLTAAGAAHVATPPGPQPRAALGYLAGTILRVLEAAGVVGPQSAALGEAADVVESLYADGSGPAVGLARDLADAIGGRVAVVYGGHGVAATAAGRWKTQINENSKSIAYASEIPELNHNEVEAWSAHPDLARKSIATVWLLDPGAHERINVRHALTMSLLNGRVGVAGEVRAVGEGRLARLFSLILVGDLVSVFLAEHTGTDPNEVPVIQDFKSRLREER